MNAQGRDERYHRVREEFDHMRLEDKAAFLVEASVATVMRGVERFTRSVADEIDKAFRKASDVKEEPEQGVNEDLKNDVKEEEPGGTPAPNVAPDVEGPGPDDIPGPRGPSAGPEPDDRSV